eukprot:m.334027 g.334027  ORF g.334027 m.334027 type:complete len:516 (+) comp17272_c0_seq1:118-1665(+)
MPSADSPTKTDILKAIEGAVDPVRSLDLAETFKCDHQVVVGIIKSLMTIPEIVDVKDVKYVSYSPTEEGNIVAQNGSFEARIYNLIPDGGILLPEFEKMPEVQALGPAGKRAQGICLKKKWIKMEKGADKTNTLKKTVDSIVDDTAQLLQAALANPEAMTEEALKAKDAKITLKDVTALVKRQLMKKEQVVASLVKPGAQFTLNPKIADSDLTPEMLKDGSWATREFKKFNLEAEPKLPAGALHPLLKVRSEFRRIFLDMGFSEMPTNNYVENSFWNFDALFQPQQHPARDAHDTFFMRVPSATKKIPDEEYMLKVKEMHEKGGHGSIGYRYDWSEDEAKKNILRTHTTAVSTRMLYQLAMEKPFRPVKYFSIDRVFRNETLDATHLAEFHQVEGVVADYNLTLGHLIGILNLFFEKLGMKDLKFKPAYNPYTEPSMEIFAYHPDLKKEVEIGNSGIFRPEMLRPMGLPEDVTVIAWGLSVERPTMIKYGYDNIRHLFGAGVDLDLVADNPICRL